MFKIFSKPPLLWCRQEVTSKSTVTGSCEWEHLVAEENKDRRNRIWGKIRAVAFGGDPRRRLAQLVLGFYVFSRASQRHWRLRMAPTVFIELRDLQLRFLPLIDLHLPREKNWISQLGKPFFFSLVIFLGHSIPATPTQRYCQCHNYDDSVITDGLSLRRGTRLSHSLKKILYS